MPTLLATTTQLVNLVASVPSWPSELSSASNGAYAAPVDDAEPETRLRAAAAAYSQATDELERAREALRVAVVEAAPVVKQAEMVRITGWSREYLRKIVSAK
jgi:hypothetical protein